MIQTKTRQEKSMKLNQVMIAAALSLAVGLGAGRAFAQNDGGNRPPGDRPPGDQNGGGRGGPRNFDPAEMQKRMMERYQEVLEITDNAEWKAIEPIVQKVAEERMQAMSGMGRGMFGGRGNRGGNNNNGGGGNNNGGGPRGGGFGQANPDAEALQKAIDAKASKAEIKAALAKYVESRKAKVAALEKAQAELRAVLTPRQEAIATLNGLL
jgi:hypothetical protein